MSLEVVEKVVSAEAQNKDRISAARAEAKRLVDEASVRAQAAVAKARSEAGERSKAKLKAAEDRVAKRSEAILAEARSAGEAL